MSSEITNIILKFYNDIKNVGDLRHDQKKIINVIEEILRENKWNMDSSKGVRGFYSEPDAGSLTKDIQKILNKI